MARNKSVSLFEVLHPREDKNGERKESAPASISAAVEASPSPIAQTQPAREFVRLEPLAQDIPEPRLRSSERIYENEVKNVSVREKNDHFLLVSAVLLSFALVTGLVGFKMGREKGFTAGAEAVIREKSSKLLGVQPVREKLVTSTTQVTPAENKAIIKASFEKPELPYSVQPMTPAQEKTMAPPVNKKYSWLLHTFGPGQSKATAELVGDLKSRGFDAFADMSRGIVYVGRLDSTKGTEAQQLKNQIAGFNWHSHRLQGYFANIPEKLLK